MKNIYLVRHGESMSNVDRVSMRNRTPDHAVPLSALGQDQADRAGVALASIMRSDRHRLYETDKVRMWTSPYVRTRDTASRVYASLCKQFPMIDMREHVNLCEQQFGLFDNIPDEELPVLFPNEHAHYQLAEKFEGRFWARMPLGESRFDVAVRIHQSFGTFHRDADRHEIENIVVVCHGVTLRAFVMQWLNLPYEWMDQEKNPGNCDIYHIGQKTHGYVYKNGQIL